MQATQDAQIRTIEPVTGGGFDERLGENYPGLSTTLRSAADFVAANPVTLATRPLRQIAKESHLSPAAFTRLARALGYQGLDELRDALRDKIDHRFSRFDDRARRLRQDYQQGKLDFFTAHADACQSNILQLSGSIDMDLLDHVVDRLRETENVYLLGALGSTGVIEYMSYLANICAPGWQVMDRSGASLGSGIANLRPQDAVIVVTKPPFAKSVLATVKLAAARGSFITVITDTHTCPALAHASAGFVLPTDSPHFFSSYVCTMFFAEVLIGKYVARSGENAETRVTEVVQYNRLLSEVSDEE